MPCLSESIRYDDPNLQQGLQTAYSATHLTELIVAAWALARVMAVQVVESVLREWAGRPTSWPPCPNCGKTLPQQRLGQAGGEEPSRCDSVATPGGSLS